MNAYVGEVCVLTTIGGHHFPVLHCGNCYLTAPNGTRPIIYVPSVLPLLAPAIRWTRFPSTFFELLDSREEPRPRLDSIIYRWTNGTLVPVRAFQTTGGTDAAFLNESGHHYLAVSNSLNEELRFKSESRIYRFQP